MMDVSVANVEDATMLFSLIVAAMGDGHSTIRAGSDPGFEELLDGLRRLGITMIRAGRSETIRVGGCGGQLPATEADLDAGRDRVARHLLLAVLAAGHGAYRVGVRSANDWTAAAPLVDALRDLGAAFTLDDRESAVNVVSRGLRGGTIVLEPPAQPDHLAALLLISPLAAGDVFVEAPPSLGGSPIVQAAIEAMRDHGAELVAESDGKFIVPAPQAYRGLSG